MRRRRRKRRMRRRRRRRRRRNKYLHYSSDSTGIIMKVALLNRFCYIPSQGPCRRGRKRESESTCTAAVFVPSHLLLADRGGLSALLSYTYWLTIFTQDYTPTLY